MIQFDLRLLGTQILERLCLAQWRADWPICELTGVADKEVDWADLEEEWKELEDVDS